MTGLLLAGGRSTRMGTDKALLELEGEPLAGRGLQALRSICPEVLVGSGDGRRLGALGAPQVADALPDAGPLGGIVAGLEAASTALVAVLAVDMPFASAAVLELLASMWSGQDTIVPVTSHGVQPLHAVYATAAGPKLRRALASGSRSVRAALEQLDVRFVGEPEWRTADPTGRFAVNVNRPEDLPAG